MPDAHYIGIDLGGTNVQAGVITPAGKLVATERTKTKPEAGPEAVLERIAKLVDDVLDEAKLARSDIAGVGIGAPGAIDVKKGVVINAVNLRWSDFPLSEKLGKRLDLPVVVDNDVNVGTWGEYQLGAGKGFDDLLGIFVGTGIGGGLVLNGKLYHGSMLTAGEIGHIVIDADAPLGRRTLENLASRTSMVNQLVQLVQSNHASSLAELMEGEDNPARKIRSKALAGAVDKSDPLTVEVIGQAARYVGIAAANAVTLLSLPCVVIGGGLTEALGDWWIKRVRAAFEEHVFPEQLRKCKVVAGTLLDDAGTVGAGLLAAQTLAGAARA